MQETSTGALRAPSAAAPAARTSARRGTVRPIDRRDRLTREEFLREYHRPRKPVIVGGLLDDWKARSSWTPQFFRENYRDVAVTAGRCFDKSTRTTVGAYVDYMEAYARGEIVETHRSPLYLEGWYFRPQCPELMEHYRSPAIFGDDWLEKWFFPDRYDPKATAILLGPKGTFTKLHPDLLSTHSWNAQLRGSKRWIFVSPDQVDKVYLETRMMGGYVPGTDVDAPDLERYPLLGELDMLEGVVHAGETIWFPMDWLHQVTALEESVSLTHNYMSGNNCLKVTSEILRAHLRRRKT